MVGIELSNVTKRFGSTVAVENICLEAKRGELFFLLGPSGCGKTTILRMIAGFEKPDSGDILFDGRSILGVPAHKRNTALVFQSYALWPHMSVEQNVAYGLDERKVPAAEKKERVARALDTVRMREYAKRKPAQLSGGQQQRVALARALVVEPDAVLLDEPLSNLDARLRLEMRNEIRRIHDETGITMVYVTHDQKESLSLADTLAVMSAGRLEQTGAPRQVYRSPVNRFVADFIGKANMIKGRLAAVDAVFGRVDTVLGRFVGRLQGGIGDVGTEVVCMIRPECLRLGSAEENCVTGKVVSGTYLGETEELEIQTEIGPIHAVMSNPGEKPPAREQEVSLVFAAGDALIMR